jgi:hypothetical protein
MGVAKRLAIAHPASPASLTRRASESCLPPIRGLRHLTSPSQVVEVSARTTSPTNTAISSPPIAATATNLSGLGDKDTLPVTVSLSPPSEPTPHITVNASSNDVGDSGETHSTVVRRDNCPSGPSIAETDHNRLFPGVSTPLTSTTPDLVKLKGDRRVSKASHGGVHDSDKNLNTSFERNHASRGGGGGAAKGGGGVVNKGQPAQNARKVLRNASMQELPKLAADEEPFSVRRKIEQFRKWHEEQYTEKLNKLKVDNEKDKPVNKASATRESHVKNHMSISMEFDFARMLEENAKNSVHAPPPSASKDGTTHRRNSRSKKLDASRDLVSVPSSRPPHASTTTTTTTKDSNNNDKSKGSHAARCKSGGTWRTWRDVNDSYAYNDVKMYIEENELLPPDRVTWIHSWLGDVEKALWKHGPGGQGDGQVKVDDPAAGEREMNGNKVDTFHSNDMLTSLLY